MLLNESQSSIFLLIFPGIFAMMGGCIFIVAWKGRGPDVWHRHGSGWIPLGALGACTFFSSCFLLIAANEFLNYDYFERGTFLHTIELVAFIGVAFIISPTLAWFAFHQPPRFIVPRNIYRSRKLRDPEIARRTLWPKGKDPVWGQDILNSTQLPYRANVNYIRFVLEAVIHLAGAPIFIWLFTLGLRGYLGRGLYSRMWPLFPLLSIALFLTFLYLTRCLLNPSPVRLNKVGVRTREWGVDWPDVREIRYLNGQLSFLVSPDLAYHYRENNKWYSGRPLSYGGWHAKDDYLHCNPRIRNGKRTRDLAIALMNTHGMGTPPKHRQHTDSSTVGQNGRETL
ncbi:hypothetical protein [Kocuria sp.]|uniref:hypothetical protein n=1 Tax=Kocuria sp. TaxID=1871328 RepID=UPI0026E0C5D3|nr:hypothetical protein [Kocuria sp.]MDO5617155.1 hypothetical protein [Kocuria sp.]